MNSHVHLSYPPVSSPKIEESDPVVHQSVDESSNPSKPQSPTEELSIHFWGPFRPSEDVSGTNHQRFKASSITGTSTTTKSPETIKPILKNSRLRFRRSTSLSSSQKHVRFEEDARLVLLAESSVGSSGSAEVESNVLRDRREIYETKGRMKRKDERV